MVVRKCNIPNDSHLFISFIETFDHEDPPTYTPYFYENFDHIEPEPPIYSFDFSEGFDS